MVVQQLIEIDRLSIDGTPLCFDHGTIVVDRDAASHQTHWHAVLLHSSLSAGVQAGKGKAHAHSADGGRLRGRVSLSDASSGAGCLRLRGIGSLYRD